MIKLKSLLKEEIDPFDLEENQELLNRIQDAAETQRGEPESAMLRAQKIIQNSHGSNVLVNAIEHTGDLAHRAQRSNAITNVEEKVNMMLQFWSPKRWPLDKEIKEGIISNCTYHYATISGKYNIVKSIEDSEERAKYWKNLEQAPEVQLLIKQSNEETSKALKMYVDAHRKYNKPITKLGLMGKNAAIALGMLRYNELHIVLYDINKWLEKYYSSNRIQQFQMFTELV